MERLINPEEVVSDLARTKELTCANCFFSKEYTPFKRVQRKGMGVCTRAPGDPICIKTISACTYGVWLIVYEGHDYKQPSRMIKFRAWVTLSDALKGYGWKNVKVVPKSQWHKTPDPGLLDFGQIDIKEEK